MGRPRDALTSAELAVSLSGQNARAHMIKGEALWNLGRQAEAVDALRRSASLHDTAGTRVRIAEMLCDRGKHGHERSELDRAIELVGRSAGLRYRRARALLHVASEDHERREECCRKAISDLEVGPEAEPGLEEAAGMLRRAREMLGGGPGGG